MNTAIQVVEVEFHKPPTFSDPTNWICKNGCHPCDSQGHVILETACGSVRSACPIYRIPPTRQREYGIVATNSVLAQQIPDTFIGWRRIAEQLHARYVWLTDEAMIVEIRGWPNYFVRIEV
jgi:hypothetical protein